ncbi:hypothetical protein CAEBREN_19874 [Caenorhabditis brenneri]|uniref:Uncharacterized protein n=1 Tax=Caenorhabditis brenneri TaxID=135651 RepID=G0P2P1_CAEBE|nr:hypothetical protein CAEBREN_19874 [Caenorhabditis brenneri]
MVKHIRWHLKDQHQGRKLVKFHYTFFVEKWGEKMNVSDQEVARWQSNGSPSNIFNYIQNQRKTRILCHQEEIDLEMIVKKIKKEKTETGLRQNIWLIQKYNGSTSPDMIQAYVAMLEKLEGLETSCQDMTLESYCSQMIESQIEYRSDTMDFFIADLLKELWKTEIFNISSFYFHFSSTIRTLFERDSRALNLHLRQIFVMMNDELDGTEEPERVSWVKENLAKKERED